MMIIIISSSGSGGGSSGSRKTGGSQTLGCVAFGTYVRPGVFMRQKYTIRSVF